MELLVLMFVSGFALATLIFWPLLHRANRQLGEQESAPRGRHALRTPAPAPPTVTRRTTAPQPAEPERPAAEEKPSEPVAPVQRTAEPTELPELPTDLYEKHFEAKFNRSRQRLARLRTEISKD
ncbi:hypothetical protein SAMN05421805_10323 [Saccharopolyspora antimicrobica]|uniref:Uncharacterized protein n=1 Tax=Saccharopolyspora antimicrobica TaxID=455193 RepID=A0A1I4WSC6_9PSEU|nr:hypothetical protein [Saccharopolyspora antimicrobica]RKT83002.1 hypothetical protein ATL45_1267 [Saccharopolyspora antimicrobica]SFN16066.1 hypothetical protein SAMN05421805_10323 [Saccharopolyspora antimicrobica]